MIRQIATTFSRLTCAASLLAILVAGTVVCRTSGPRRRTTVGDSEAAWDSHPERSMARYSTLAFSGDYFLDRNFSVGPLMQISPTGDLFQISFAGVGRYYFRLNNGINLVPFTGIGLIHADPRPRDRPWAHRPQRHELVHPYWCLTRVPGYPQCRLDCRR